MRILKKFVRKLYHLIWFLSLYLLFLIPVNAEVDTQLSTTMLGRDWSSMPFTTGYAADEVTYYTNNLRVYGSNANLVNLPRYLYFIYCANADFNIVTTNVYKGGITHQGATKGGTCQMQQNGQYYNGYYYLDRWTITSWSDYSSSGVYEYGVQWRVYPDNTASYYAIMRGESLFLSNELITDFASDYILQSLINSNGSINNSISSIKQDTNSLKNGQNEIKKKQDATNKKLDDLNDAQKETNDTIKDSKVDSSDSTINNLKDKIPTNSVISDLLLLPVRFLQNFVNALGSSCFRFSLGSLYGTELFMPCINIENYLGSGIWTTIDLIISGLFVYSLRKKFIEIYENLTNLKNGGNEVD